MNNKALGQQKLVDETLVDIAAKQWIKTCIQLLNYQKEQKANKKLNNSGVSILK